MENLSQFEQAFDQNPVNAVAMNAVTANGINACAQNYQIPRKDVHEFSVSLKQGKVTNQKKSGRCWMFAALNCLRFSVMKKLNLDTFELSQSYTLFYDKLEKSNYFLESILESLEMKIVSETAEGWVIDVPVYRIDVQRDVDVIEDILRIYGYNNVEFSDNVKSNLSYQTPTDRSYKLQNLISEQLCGCGFNEILNNSLTRSAYYDNLSTYPVSHCVMLMNPLSADLNCMRQTLLFGGLESVEHNAKRKNGNIRFFEFGNCYDYNIDHKKEGETLAEFSEDYRLGLWVSGSRVDNNWAHPNEKSSVYELKAYVENILVRLGVNLQKVIFGNLANDIYSAGLSITTSSGRQLGTMGIVSPKICKELDIETDVYYAELSWTLLMKEIKKSKVTFSEISKFPAVKRDLALLLDKNVQFAEIEKIATESERKLLKNIALFDVYEGKNLPAGKKSYAVSFYLQDEGKTLNDKQIDAIMKKIQTNLEQKLGAQLR